MTRIPENILNEIQDRCDIVEIISSYIPLKTAGRNFKAVCPFHHEKTPSFVVSPDKQIYHCFGCNSGGNVFNFIRQYEKIDFIETVKMLAQKTGVKLPERKAQDNEEDSLVSTIYSINDIACNYYTNLLEKSQGASKIRRYIEKRGLEEGILKKFRIGYVDSSWSGLLGYLSKRGINQDMILKAGLIVRGKESSFYDLFRDRMIFPIFDVRSKLLGFGARVLGDTIPKYINSPETTVYRKGKHLYGLNLAKTCIREKGFAIITEGYLDVIKSHQYGINNTISSLGTALTVEQIRLLRRYTHNVVMVYDADQAGQEAALRGMDLFLEEGMHVKVAVLDKGHDPDSFIRKFGPRGFDVAVKKAKSLFDYKLSILNERFDNSEPEGKAEIVTQMLSTISRVRNAVIKAEYIKKLSEELLVKEDAIWQELKELARSSKKRNIMKDKGKLAQKTINVLPAEKIIVKLMLEDMSVVNIVKENLKPFNFKNPDVRHLVETLFSLDTQESMLDATKLINFLGDKVESNVITYIVNDEVDIRDKERNLSDCIRTIKKQEKDDKLKDIQNRLQVAQKNGYGEESRNLLKEFNRLLKEGKA